MSIGIIGIGCVGNAIYQNFLDKGINVIAYDKYKKIGILEDLIKTDILFLCLPTLYNEELNEYDKTAIVEICEYLLMNKYQGLVVIKSTVEPGVTQELSVKYNLNLFHNPEFLTARTAYQDFNNQKHIIIGSSNRITVEQLELLTNFFKKYYPDAEISTCKSTESESVKIFCNCFYAVKVQFFNELYFLCQKVNVDYNHIRDMMLKNGWINPMHTQVPGIDGNFSYGGMCFPKDTNALLAFMKSQKTPYQILDATIKERNFMRQD